MFSMMERTRISACSRSRIVSDSRLAPRKVPARPRNQRVPWAMQKVKMSCLDMSSSGAMGMETLMPPLISPSRNSREEW